MRILWQWVKRYSERIYIEQRRVCTGEKNLFLEKKRVLRIFYWLEIRKN